MQNKLRKEPKKKSQFENGKNQIHINKSKTINTIKYKINKQHIKTHNVHKKQKQKHMEIVQNKSNNIQNSVKESQKNR